MNEPRFCKDCKFFHTTNRSFHSLSSCQHPNNIEVDLVNGGRLLRDIPSDIRKSYNLCGSEGSWFVPIIEKV